MTAVLDAARQLAGIGLCVVPLHPPSGPADGKAPRIHGWNKAATSDPAQVERWFTKWQDSNVGVLMGKRSGVVCIDCDLRNGAQAWIDEHHESLMGAGAILQLTPTGGRHYFFRHPGKFVTTHAGKAGIAPGVELLADGGGKQVVVAPSINGAVGKAYRFPSLTLADIDYAGTLPDWIGNRLEEEPENTNQLSTFVGAGTASESVREALLSDLERLEPGAGGRDRTIGRWIMDAVGAGLDHAEVKERAQDWLYAHGRQEGEQPREVDNWIRSASVKAESGELYVSDTRLRQDIMFEDEPIWPVSLLKQAQEAKTWANMLSVSKQGMVHRTHVHNVATVYQYHEHFLIPDTQTSPLCFNDFTQQTWLQAPVVGTPPDEQELWPDEGKPIEDIDLLRLKQNSTVDCGRGLLMEPALDTVHSAAMLVAYSHRVHPVQNYLNSLRWDGKPRIESWLKHFLGAEDNEYVSIVSKRWLIAAVARVMNPGCKVDNALVLAGKEGLGKSSIACLLCPVRDWFSDSIGEDRHALEDKDTLQKLNGKWIIELAENAVANRASESAMKHFLTKQEDKFREAYGRFPKTVKRQCVFMVTTNEEEFLRDVSGGRRYWPVGVHAPLDFDKFTATRDQLWAEALVHYRKGEPWWLANAHEIALARKEQQFRSVTDARDEILREWLAGKKEVSLLTVWTEAMGRTETTFERKEQQIVTNALRRFGYTKKPGQNSTWMLTE